MKPFRNAGRWVLSRKPIAHFPVRVRSGIAEGAAWTFFPWTSYWRGTHEANIQSAIAGLFDWTGKSVWDLGSHYGLYAVGLARRVGPTGSVAAFEPNPLAFQRLQLHLARNCLTWAKAFPCAVSDTSDSQRLFLYQGMEVTTSHLAYPGETWDKKIPSLMVNCVRLDDLVGSHQIMPPDFIKLDVEGHGHRALAGAREVITDRRPTILAAVHGDEEFAGIRGVLEPLGYSHRPVCGHASAAATTFDDYLFEPSAR